MTLNFGKHSLTIGLKPSSKAYVALGTRAKYAIDEKYFQFIIWLFLWEFVIEIA